MVKEILLKDATNLPKTLQTFRDKAAPYLTGATWNGFNVWLPPETETQVKDAKTLRGCGFALAKSGKHANQWFANEKSISRAVERAAKKLEAQKSEPKSEQPKATLEPEPPTTDCYAALLELYYNSGTKKVLSPVRANCTSEELYDYLKAEHPKAFYACKEFKLLAVICISPVKSDTTLRKKVSAQFADEVGMGFKVLPVRHIDVARQIKVPDDTPTEEKPENCIIIEADDKKKGTHVINLVRTRNTIADLEKHFRTKLPKNLENFKFRKVKTYKTDGQFMAAFKRMKDYKGMECYKQVLHVNLAA